jgi:hypothetical protein
MSDARRPGECVDCAALPYPPVLPWTGDGPVRPTTPRPTDGAPRKPRCATHKRAHQKAQKARAHDTSAQRTFGVPEGWYAEQLRRQGGKCAFPKCRATGKAQAAGS